MQPLDAAILRTLIYADVFQYAMSPDEIHRYLIHSSLTDIQSVHERLLKSPTLQRLLYYSQGYVTLAEHQHYIALRLSRVAHSERLWSQALRYGRWMAIIPFVRMVSLTGSLAVRNCYDDQDDIDYLLVTEPGRVWIARALAIVIVRIARLRGIHLCPNYITSSNRMRQSRHDLYIAHEITQMIPLFGYDLYQSLYVLNEWATDFLPNAKPHAPEYIQQSPARTKRFIERLLNTRIGDWIEEWEFRRKARRFKNSVEQPNSDARITSDEVKGHFEDHGHTILKAYAERLRKYGLSTSVKSSLSA